MQKIRDSMPHPKGMEEFTKANEDSDDRGKHIPLAVEGMNRILSQESRGYVIYFPTMEQTPTNFFSRTGNNLLLMIMSKNDSKINYEWSRRSDVNRMIKHC